MSAAPVLTSLEAKLLHLALNKGSAPGEISASALKLIHSLRERGIDPYAIEQALTPHQFPAKQFKPDYGLCLMPWGPNKGKPFCEISPHELRSAVRWAKSRPGVARRFADFIQDAQLFLEGGG